MVASVLMFEGIHLHSGPSIPPLPTKKILWCSSAHLQYIWSVFVNYLAKLSIKPTNLFEKTHQTVRQKWQSWEVLCCVISLLSLMWLSPPPFLNSSPETWMIISLITMKLKNWSQIKNPQPKISFKMYFIELSIFCSPV